MRSVPQHVKDPRWLRKPVTLDCTPLSPLLGGRTTLVTGNKRSMLSCYLGGLLCQWSKKSYPKYIGLEFNFKEHIGLTT